MTAGPSSNITNDLLDRPVTPSLESTFQHPAGLQTARRLVRVLIRAQQSVKPSCQFSGLMSLPSTSWASDLREILTFGDVQGTPYVQNSASTRSQEAGDGMGAGRYGAVQAFGGNPLSEGSDIAQTDFRRSGLGPPFQSQPPILPQAVRSISSSSGPGKGIESQANQVNRSITAVHSLHMRPPLSYEQSRRPALPILLPASQRMYPQASQTRLAPAPQNSSARALLPFGNPLPGKLAKMPSRKRKLLPDDGAQHKKQKIVKTTSSKRGPKPKDKSGSAAYKIDEVLWMRILEFSPPSFLIKARLISKGIKAIIDRFDSIFINCCKENYGTDMPLPPAGLNVKQYLDLLQGKGCLEPNCGDTKASKTSWSWVKRWCATCWKNKLEREDRVIKSRQNEYTRITITKMLECIPAGMHDSFLKPHDYIDDMDSRPRGAPRLYKYYMTEDITRIIAEYEALTPAPFVEDPARSAEENGAARDAHQGLMDALDEKRAAFFAERKAKNDAHMTIVKQIEQGVRKRMLAIRAMHDECRNARKELFTKRAREQLPHIPEDDITRMACYKAAVRIFRDKGSERGWLTLKAKIEKEWKAQGSGQRSGNATPLTWAAGWDGLFVEQNSPLEISNSQDSSQSAVDFRPATHMRPNSCPYPLARRSDTTSIDTLAAAASFMNQTTPGNMRPSPFPLQSTSSSSSSASSSTLMAHPSRNSSTPSNGTSSRTQISVSSLLRPQSPSAPPHYNPF